VSLVAPDGGLPDENLEPLLRARQGEKLDPEVLRADLALLFQVGGFDAVEAWVEPWLSVDEAGEPFEAVHVVYRVYAPPTVGKVRIEGVKGPARRIVEGAHGLDRGEPYHLEDELVLKERLTTALEQEGWTRAEVQVSSTSRDELVRDVTIEVSPKRPKRFQQVKVAGNLGLEEERRFLFFRYQRDPEKQIRRWLGREGVKEHERVVAESVKNARERVLDKLEGKGFVEAHVNVVYSPDQTGLTVLVDAGPKLEVWWTARHDGEEPVQVERHGGFLRAKRPSRVDWQSIVGVRGRVADVTVDEARDNVATWYAAQGFVDAQVDVDLTTDAERALVKVGVRTGPKHKLRRIDVVGADTFGERWIRGAVKEAGPETIDRRIATREAAEEALTAVRQFYEGQGFLDAQVELEQLEFHKRGPWARVFNRQPTSIHVQVVEGPRTSLATITTSGGTGAELDILRAGGRDLAGGPLQTAKLERLTIDIADAYRQQGYLHADATLRTELHDGTADARIAIDPGELVRLRSIIVRGNQRTKRRAIVREIPIEIGDPITPQALAETRAALYELDTFRVVSPEVIGDDARTKDLIINLEEKPNILVETGGGLSTDQGVTVLVRATHRNIGGLGHHLSATGKAGFGYAGDSWALDTLEPTWSAGLHYEAPYVPGRNKRLVADVLLNEALQESTFRLTRFGVATGIHFKVSRKSAAVVDYHAQMRRLEDVDPGALVNGDPWLPYLALDSPEEGVPSTPSDRRPVTGLGVSWITDLRDDRFNPMRGTYLSGILDLGDGLVTDDATFKGTARVQQLVGLGQLVLDVVGQGGVAWAEGRGTTLGVEDRFYLGGAATMRGFHQNTVGPANQVARPEVDFPEQIEPLIDGTTLASDPEHWVPTGGDAMAALSVELRTPMPLLGFESLDGWSWVVFTDIGHVGFLDYTITTTSRLEGLDPPVRIGIGTGLRVATPIGPASFDVGFNPYPLDERDEPFVLVHLSIGAL
jgi:outer membrane protein assembly complex protein YaeT